MLTGIRPEFNEIGEPVAPSAFCDVLLSSADENYFSDENLDVEQISREVVNVIDYLDLVVLRCLQKEPRSRFKSIEELRAVVEKAGHDFKLDIIIEKSAAAAAFAEASAAGKPDKEAAPVPTPIKEGSAVKKIKHSTLVTRVLAGPPPEEPKTSKTLLLKYNKPKPQAAPENKAAEPPKSGGTAGHTKPALKPQLEDRPRKRGTVYKGESAADMPVAQYAVTAVIVIAAAAAAFTIYSKYFS
jgi:hypothetical protein